MGENGASHLEVSGEIKDLNGYHNGSGENGHSSSSKSKERRKETEEERNIRKEKERKEREDRYKREGKRPETEEERKIRKEKEKRDRERKEGSKKREETEEERKIRKEKERKEREERHKKDGKRDETEEERRIRKEKERKRDETEEERRIRKEKERKEKEEGKSSSSKHRKESEEERRIRKEKERKERKEKESSSTKIKEEVKEDESSQDFKAEPMDTSNNFKEEPEDDEEEKSLSKSRSSKAPKRKNDFDDDDEDQDFKEEDEDDEEEYSKPPSKKKKSKNAYSDDDYDEDVKPKKAAKKPAPKKAAAKAPPPPPPKKGSAAARKAPPPPATPTKGGGRKKKEEPEQKVWKWWEEEKKDDGTKWKFLQHKGPLIAPLYERLPEYVNFYYEGKKMRLSEEAEECATFYGKMLDHDYTTKEVFNKNFFKDWRKSMTEKEKEKIRDLSKCDFTEINTYFKKVSEERKGRSKEARKAEKEANDAIQAEYGITIIDGHEEKIGNFRIEPPGLFRGRGEHPKQGMIKRRVQPEDVIINCSKDSEWPKAPAGHKWKEVRHDNTVTWLASWTENIQNQIKYVMLNPSSRLKGEKDMEKYEKARRLKLKIGKMREDYTADFKSKEMRVRQRSVALYFIDKLALRAGNEKDEDQADTVGCCSLRVEHIKLHEEHDGKDNVVEFDFLGKDSIRYHNFVQVEKRVFKNLQLFMENKKEGDDLFDRLNTSILNEYLSSLMPGLTAKVFRTYNASITLQDQLNKLTEADDNIPAKMLSYNRANRAVALLCNHQRAVPKGHDVSMANLQDKIDKKTEEVEKAEREYKQAKKSKGAEAEKRKATVKRLLEQLNRLETQKTDKEENKQIALGTSKLNYLDPRISVAWCKKYDVPLEKVYNKTQREKFRWAVEMTDEDYVF